MEMEAVFARDGLRAVAPAEQIKKQDEDRDMEQRAFSEQRADDRIADEADV